MDQPQAVCPPPSAGLSAGKHTLLANQYHQIRQQTLLLCQPLQAADYELQAAEFTSPAKWHLAHTSWFFETFLLKPHLSGYQPFHPQYSQLFNSYYNGIGQPYPRAQRGLLSRPALDQVLAYREFIDNAMQPLLSEPALVPLIELGLNHEQQHQELLLTDLLYCWSFNPLCPVYQTDQPLPAAISDNSWQEFDGGMYCIGHKPGKGFAFDNESPRHQLYVGDFALARRLTSNREYLEFIQDGGYQQPQLWLADGWNWVQQHQIQAPLYWRDSSAGLQQYSLNGLRPLALDAPVCHVSFYEADAFARWSGARLATEAEWEVSASGLDPQQGHFADSGRFSPSPAGTARGVQQQFGDCWEWTSSPYQPYPGYQPAAGAVGEYNGKFMCNQMVLRGGSCATAAGHIRTSYRNFFYPHERWQFSGIRLAR